MDDLSVFQDKNVMPTKEDLFEKLVDLYSIWVQLHDCTIEKYPNAICEWSYSGKKYGWSYKIKDKKRVIIYLLPRDKYFKVAFVFGQKAYDSIMNIDISIEIKNELEKAKKYAEGRGIRIDIKSAEIVSEIKKLVDIKLRN